MFVERNQNKLTTPKLESVRTTLRRDPSICVIRSDWIDDSMHLLMGWNRAVQTSYLSVLFLSVVYILAHRLVIKFN